MQRIRVAMALDGERGWHPRDVLAEFTIGPLGMLAMPEIPSGLSCMALSPEVRLEQMYGFLSIVRTGAPRYEKRPPVDALSTAIALLTG